MPTIKIADLQISGADLFADSESYLNELDDSALLATQIKGGSPPVVVTAVASAIASAISGFSAGVWLTRKLLE